MADEVRTILTDRRLHVLTVTGIPGVGKFTFISELLRWPDLGDVATVLDLKHIRDRLLHQDVGILHDLLRALRCEAMPSLKSSRIPVSVFRSHEVLSIY